MEYGWTLKFEQWKLLIKVAAGTQWKKTRLRELFCDDVPVKPGVYAICSTLQCLPFKPFSKLYNVIYVGKEGVSLNRRFLEHCRNPKSELVDAKNCYGGNLDFWYTVIESQKVGRLEALLIECLGPKGNRIRGTIKAKIGKPRSA